MINTDIIKQSKRFLNISWKKALALTIYFSLAGYLFDILNPEANLTYALATRSGNGLQVGPHGTSLILGSFIIYNALAGIISFLVLRIAKNVFISGPICGFIYASIGYIYLTLGIVGISNVVLHAVFGISLFAILILDVHIRKLEVNLYACRDIIKKQKNISLTTNLIEKTMEDSRTALWELLKLLAQAAFSYAAITGVSMTILFKDGYENILSKLLAIQMATAFFLCVASLYIWLAVPLINAVWDLHYISAPNNENQHISGEKVKTNRTKETKQSKSRQKGK